MINIIFETEAIILAIKFFNEHAKSIVSDEDIKAIAPKAVEAPLMIKLVRVMTFSVGLICLQIMIKKNLQELKKQLSILNQMQIYL